MIIPVLAQASTRNSPDKRHPFRMEQINFTVTREAHIKPTRLLVQFLAPSVGVCQSVIDQDSEPLTAAPPSVCECVNWKTLCLLR